MRPPCLVAGLLSYHPCQALQGFTCTVQKSTALDAEKFVDKDKGQEDEQAIPNDILVYLCRLQAAGHFPADKLWRLRWRLMMSLEAIEPARALKALRSCERKTLIAAQHSLEFDPWQELCFALDHALSKQPSATDSCLNDVRSALLMARQLNEAPEEEDLFTDVDMMYLLGELPCSQAVRLLRNHCDPPVGSMIQLVHAIANCIARHQGGMCLGLQRKHCNCNLIC